MNIVATWDPEDPCRIVSVRSKREVTYQSLAPIVQQAVDIATEAHRYQLRKDGKTPYIYHCWCVLYIAIVCEWNFTDEELAAFVLHDVIEDTCWPFECVQINVDTNGIRYLAVPANAEPHPLRHLQFAKLEELMQTETAAIVWLLTKPEGKPFRRRIYVASIHRCGPTVIAGKLADALSNLQDLPSIGIITKVTGQRKKCGWCNGYGVTHADNRAAETCYRCKGSGWDDSNYHVEVTKEDLDFAAKFKLKVKEDILPLIPILRMHGPMWHNIANWFEIRIMRLLI